jgi:hypothetical protein
MAESLKSHDIASSRLALTALSSRAPLRGKAGRSPRAAKEGTMANTTDMPVIETAMQGWRDAAAAREKMPMLVWTAIAVLIALSILNALIGGLGIFSFIVQVVFVVAQALALTPLAIAVHRFVLLGEAQDRYDFAPGDARFQKFFLFTIALEVLGAIPQIIAFLFAIVAPFLAPIVLLILAIGAAIVGVRTAILFPSIAVDAPGADWRNAMADAKGHSWRIFFVLFCVALPAVVVELVLIAIFSWMWLLATIVAALIVPVITVFLVAAVAAAASRLYAAYANQLGRPTSSYMRAPV